ncbi:hypothetical protein FIU94_00300 [Sulfitobacter sp. THAF37]|nr:hypothetical protein FIU94_00300 [Sulfitobacter sp. THAF37]
MSFLTCLLGHVKNDMSSFAMRHILVREFRGFARMRQRSPDRSPPRRSGYVLAVFNSTCACNDAASEFNLASATSPNSGIMSSLIQS